MSEDMLPFLRSAGPGGLRALLDAFGHKEGRRIAKAGGREEIMTLLRLEKGWTLERVGSLFNLTRERVRQLTPAGIWGMTERQTRLERALLETALKKAARTADAWHDESTSGVLSARWMAAELDVPADHFSRYHEGRLRDFHFKADTLLRYGLGLATERAMRRWYREHYWSQGMSFAELAETISDRTGVHIGAMAIWRYFVQKLELPRRGRGEYPRRWDPEEG